MTAQPKDLLDEPWEAGRDGVLYKGQPHSYTYEIATFCAKHTERGKGDPVGIDDARCKLAAGAPSMAKVLLLLAEGGKRKRLMPQIRSALLEAGVIDLNEFHLRAKEDDAKKARRRKR